MIYLSDKYANSENNIASRKLFDACGVKYTRLALDEDKKIEIELSGKIEIIIIKLFNIRFFTQQADPKFKFYYCPPLQCNTQLKL